MTHALEVVIFVDKTASHLGQDLSTLFSSAKNFLASAQIWLNCLMRLDRVMRWVVIISTVRKISHFDCNHGIEKSSQARRSCGFGIDPICPRSPFESGLHLAAVRPTSWPSKHIDHPIECSWPGPLDRRRLSRTTVVTSQFITSSHKGRSPSSHSYQSGR